MGDGEGAAKESKKGRNWGEGPGARRREPWVKQQPDALACILSSIPSGCKMMLLKGLEKK